jgi:acid phosphatase
MMRLRRAALAFALQVCAVLLAAPAARAGEADNPFAKIKHFVVIYGENLSFDGLFGKFPGADGLEAAKSAPPQIDHDGSVPPELPPVRLNDKEDNGAEVYLEKALPNAPFNIEDHLEKGKPTGDLVHRFYQEQEQINDGKNDRFAAVSDAGGLAMGYYHDENMNLWKLAKEFTLFDRFHHAAFGGSFINHFWLICACTPEFKEVRTHEKEIECGTDDKGQPVKIPKLQICLDDAGRYLRRTKDSPPSAQEKGGPKFVNDAQVTPDGFAVNTLQPVYPPHREAHKPADVLKRLPPQSATTIGDRLSKAGKTWAWYAGGWNDVLAGKIIPYRKPENFQPHHQPFNYFTNYAPGEVDRAHLQDESDFVEAIRTGNLPAVSFWKPVGRDTMHPGYTDVRTGDARMGEIVDLIRKSPQWKDTAIIITFDENGGTWDHVAPPKRDRWGPGVRVPALLISPYARRGFVDHTVYDTTAILKTLEVRFDLPAMTEADAASPDLRAAFDFAQSP